MKREHRQTKELTFQLPTKVRVHRLIALCSDLSRRKAEEAILASRVEVNGKLITALGMSVEPAKDEVRLDGRLLQLPAARLYVAFHKPPDCLVTANDPEGRKTIWAYLPEWKGKLKPAGRLDFNSEGLVILSNDGDFLQALMHPSFEVWKTYRVKVKGIPTAAALGKLHRGIPLDDDDAALPAQAKIVSKGESNSWLEIAIREGKKREVRRMCESMGHPALRLIRIRVHAISLGTLKKGEWRHLTAEELAAW